MPHITKIGIAYQPWEGSPDSPRFLKPIYRIEYEVPTGQRQHAMEFPASDSIEANQIASKALNIPFSLY